MVSLVIQNLFSLMESYFFIFAFVAFAVIVKLKKKKKTTAKTSVKELTIYVFF